jgi:ubiquinone/menaquinone biosynthesis C-methylase UbiE
MSSTETVVWDHEAAPVANEIVHLPFSNPAVFATVDIVTDGVEGIGEQFRGGAEVYDERYLQVDSKIQVIKEAFKHIKANWQNFEVALDVGCGSGNATFALLQIFENIHIYATDLSPEMVQLLASRAFRLGQKDRVTPFVADSSKLAFKHNSFDLLVGSSMLHHLLDPAGFLDSVLNGVRPDGVCMFTEPFQTGHLVLRQVLTQLVTLSKYNPGFAEHHIKFFRDYIFTIDTMFRRDRDNPIFATLDDKWMFTKSLFYDAASRAGMRCVIFNGHVSATVFSDRVVDLIRLGLGETITLPSWAEEVIREIDVLVGQDLGEEVLLEGCIVIGRN